MHQTSVNMPSVQVIHNEEWENKKFDYDILYSQPKSQISGSEEQPPLMPFDEKLSIVDARSVATFLAIRKFPDYLLQQLPVGAKLGSDNDFDYKIIVEMEAHNKKGPVYASHEKVESAVTSLLTLGMTPNERELIADFKVTYRLLNSNGTELFDKSFNINNRVDHIAYEGLYGTQRIYDNESKLLEKYLVITLNEFITEYIDTKGNDERV